MNNNFRILACFTRSYDKHHNNNNLHLIASTVLIRDKISDNFMSHIKNSFDRRKALIVEVFNSENLINSAADYLVKDLNFKEDIFENDYLAYLGLSFNELLKIYSSNKKQDYIRELFHYGATEVKPEDQIYTQTFFIFNNITWSNIVFKFKINNINISGGGTNTRHILTSSDIILNNFLNMCYDYNSEYIINLGYNTYKNEKEIMSGQIPLNLYRRYLCHLEEVYNLNPDEIFNKIKLLIELDTDLSNNDLYIKIIANNLLISREIIIDQIISHYRNILIEKISMELKFRISERDRYSLKYDVLTRDTKNMSNKSKKKLKQERKELIYKGLNLDNFSYKMDNYNSIISELEAKLAINQEELDKKIDNLKKLNFNELFQQYEKVGHKFIYGGFNRIISRKYKKNLEIRKYSTYSLRRIHLK